MLKASVTRTCIVYSSEDGRIVHVHKEITIAGGLERPEAEIEARARQFAARRGRAPEELRVLFVEDRRSKGKRYKVDIDTLELVEVQDLT
jgi:hypothetical protein